MDGIDTIANSLIEQDTKKLQNIAISSSKILKEEMLRTQLKCSFFETRVYNTKVVGVQGDARTYGYPVEITVLNPMHPDGRPYKEKELYDFLQVVGSRIPNEINEVNKVVYVTARKVPKC